MTAEFCQHVLDVRARRRIRYTQSFGNAVRVTPVDEKLEHFTLPGAQQGGLRSERITRRGGLAHRSVEDLRRQYCGTTSNSLDGVEKH